MKKIIFTLTVVLSILSCKQVKKTETAQEKFEQKQPPKRGGMGNYTDDMNKTLEGNPFAGIFTSKGKQNDLFPIKSTGVSTEPVVKSAQTFVNSLDEEEQEKTVFDIQSDEWRKWSNVDNGMYKRNGISLKEMTQEQRKLAFHLLSEALSAKGLQLTKDIMKTDQTLKELSNGDDIYDEHLYFFKILGKPSKTEPWGFQLNGHHLALNYFVLADQVVMTPTFMGGEPIITTTGKYKGNKIFQDEQNIGLKFMQSLPKTLQEKAILGEKGNRPDIEASAYSDNKTIDFNGLKASELTNEQKDKLIHLASLYINNLREDQAKIKMEDIQQHIDESYFGWKGTTDVDAVFYYRIHSPVILIEFDHQAPVGIRGERKPTRNHIHTMVRTPNGNDYGKDYLRQHLENHQH